MLKHSLENIYKIFYPQGAAPALPLIFDSPHSGRIYPEDFGYACPFRLLQKAEDNYVDELFAAAPHYGSTLLCALFPRTYIDVNRSESDIDKTLLRDDWPHPAKPTVRSHAGIGLIRRLLQPGLPVYDRKLQARDIIHRINHYYKPYHKALETLMDEAHYRYGQVWHINCHSMPSATAIPLQSSASSVSKQKSLPDFVIGTRDGTSCAAEFTDIVRHTLENMGYNIAVNDPYKGVELVRRYSRPSAGRHSLQIEINKALYWDEASGIKSINYNILKDDINRLIEACAAYTESKLVNLAAD